MLVRSRELNGQILQSFNAHLGNTALVPSLGRVADHVVDGLGFPTPAVSLLHVVYINARRSPGRGRRWFIKVMANRGMSLMEAAMFWNIVELPSGSRFRFRVRMDIHPN